MNKSKTTAALRQDDPGETIGSKIRFWIARARASGNHFTVFRPYYRVMSKLDALFLGDLMNLAAMTHWTGDWFKCTAAYLESVGWTVDEQRQRFESLRKRGWVKTERRGLPPVRWVSVEIEAIETALDESEPDETRPDQWRANARDRSRANARESKEYSKTSSCRIPKKTGKPGRAAPAAGPPADPDFLVGETPPATTPGCRAPGPGTDIHRPDPGVPRPVFEESPPAGPAPPDNRGMPADPPERAAVEELIPPTRTARDARPRCPTEPVDHARAKTLSAFAAANKLKTTSSPRAWEHEFARLRRALGDAHGDVDRVLAWYVGWWAPGKKPAVRDGKDFRRLFGWLSDLAARSAPPPPAEPSADAKDVLRHLDALSWPPAAAAQLPGAVEQSLANYRAFVRAGGRDKKLFDRGTAFAGDPVSFVAQWFRDAHKSTRRLTRWSGDLGPFVWRPTHAVFLSRVYAELRAYGIDDAAAAWASAAAAPAPKGKS